MADGILETWYACEEGGAAIATIAFGDVNPTGRFPLTFYGKTSHLPPFDDYAMTVRSYRFFEGEPIFRFGEGMSYTRFRYRDPLVTVDERRGPAVAVTVDNVGARAGDEVVEVYVSSPFRSGGAPIENRHLAGLARVSVPLADSRRVTIPLGWWSFNSVDVSGQRTVLSGRFNIFIGGGQPAVATAGIVASLDLASGFDDGSVIRTM